MFRHTNSQSVTQKINFYISLGNFCTVTGTDKKIRKNTGQLCDILRTALNKIKQQTENQQHQEIQHKTGNAGNLGLSIVTWGVG